MDVAHELLALLERFAARTPLPRVRALHLPPAAMMNTRAGEFCAIELDDGSLGLTFVLLDASTRRLVADGGDPSLGLEGADALALAGWFTDVPGRRRALGFAAVNALTRCLFERTGFVPPASTNSIGTLEPVAADHIGMIGLFPPLVKSIVNAGARLTVVELRADLAGERDGYRVTTDRSELAGCNKVISTSTLLLNGSLDAMLSACSQARSFALIGPGAGCLPDPLFARGVTLMGGTWITDGEAFRAALAIGEPWTASAHKVAIGRQDYPGFEALLDRL
ncbi:MAG TPA: DUF364 domain-containing protein [Ramlibacter sp.]|nr:DUF364 domain-containing protein [Ramlibacter sp.]